ncbi:MAG: alpha/beta hydrolase-fold protein [Balneolaceae bacterium]
MLIFGTKGTPTLVFPTETGRFDEWENQGMIQAVQEQVHEGYNQVFCVDCIADECFLNKKADPCNRIVRHTQYVMYILDEVLPFIFERNSNPYLISTGVGLGAYYSLFLAFRYPQHFKKVLGLSGCYNIKSYLDEFSNDQVSFNNPVDFIPNINDGELLKKLNSLDIRLLSYNNDRNKEANMEISETLWTQFIEHQFFILDENANNKWSLIPSMFKEHLI